MKRTLFRFAAPAVVPLAVFIALTSLLNGQTSPTPSTKNAEWPMDTADLSGGKHSGEYIAYALP